MITLEVIGYKGIVGNATYQWLRAMHGHDDRVMITGKDINERTCPYEAYSKSVACFICVPETIVHEVCQEASQYAQWLIIRSTVTPGTCETIAKENKVIVSHNPEFLKEATALQDTFNPDFILLGLMDEEEQDFLYDIYEPAQKPIIITTTRISELTKLTINCYLACQISFWNEIEEIASQLGISSHRVGAIANHDSRVSTYGSRFHNQYGGKCLPKDMKQLITFAKAYGVKPKLLEVIEEVNKCQISLSQSQPIMKKQQSEELLEVSSM